MNLTHEVGIRLCESWGLQPEEVRRIEIVLDANERWPYANITVRLNEEVMRVVMQLESRIGE